jgi:hypothetical protein
MQNGDEYASLQDPAVTLLVLADRPASPGEQGDAEAGTAMEEYREWSAAGRPGAISHDAAKRLLLGESG